ncbi:MAG TPA: DUF2911 domain-containing protein [Gemmatimonadales bacterium]|jgi:hypothetical protein|nr:DUF2911 domain-containing protein [Gemmatimonadales bacterium]
MRSLLAIAALALSAVPLSAQTAGFVVLLGRDTVALEQVTRSPSRIEGDLFTIFPRARRAHYVATLDASGHVAHFELKSDPALATPPAPSTSLVMDVADTLATIIRTQTTAQGSRSDTTRFKVSVGAVPFLSLSTGLLEQLTIQAARAGKDSVAIDVLVAGQRQATPNYVARRGPDSVAVDYFGTPFYLRVDRAGRVLGLNGIRTTQKFLVSRVPALNLELSAQPFLAKERAGQRAGQLSPRDTARAVIAGASVTVDYGRPSMRGRVILGGIVPWGEVWRTGANSATQLETTSDLLVGETVIPAGKYTLWTLPTPTGVQLIINKRTGQWGTEYDPTQDLVRLELKSEPLPGVVEQFTIAVIDLGKAGELRFDWDRARWILPFSLRAP